MTRHLIRAPKWLRLVYHLPSFARLFWRLWSDPRVSVYRKAIPALTAFFALLVGVAYVAMKVDLIPDFLPFIGRMDDIVVLLALVFAPGAWLFVRLCPRDVVEEHVRARGRLGRGA